MGPKGITSEGESIERLIGVAESLNNRRDGKQGQGDHIWLLECVYPTQYRGVTRAERKANQEVERHSIETTWPFWKNEIFAGESKMLTNQ